MTAGARTAGTVRAVHGAVRVAGLVAPHDTVHYRIFHPAAPTGDDRERLTGQVAPDDRQAPWPVVLVLPGINVGPEGYRWFAESLVPRGYAVVTMALVGETMPGVVGITPGIDLDAVRPDTYGTRPSGIAIAAVLEELARHQHDGPLAGLLDTGRVVLGGHSGGGTVALENARRDWFPTLVARFAVAAHTMASTVLGWEPGTVLAVEDQMPTMLLAAELDGVMARSADRYQRPAAGHDPVGRTFDEALPTGGEDSYLAVVAGATHTSFIHPRDDTTARGFLDPPPGRPGSDIRCDVAGLIGDFCDAHVRQQPAARDRLLHRLTDPAAVVRYRIA